MIHAATFFRGHLDETQALVAELVEQGDAEVIHLFDNGSDPEALAEMLLALPKHADLAIYRTPDACLTEMWNTAWNAAKADGATRLAILNNDITIGPRFLGNLAQAFEIDPDLWVICPEYTLPVGSRRSTSLFIRRITGVGAAHDGMSGWAFMVDTTKPWPKPPVDPQFRWWCGDDDIALTVQHSGGKIGMVMGLPCDHGLSMTWAERPELIPIADEDMARCRLKWGSMYP